MNKTIDYLKEIKKATDRALKSAQQGQEVSFDDLNIIDNSLEGLRKEKGIDTNEFLNQLG